MEHSLQELDNIVQKLTESGNLDDAVKFSLQALEIRRQYFGPESIEFVRARLQAVMLILQAAPVHEASERFKETAELLGHVDRFTDKALPSSMTALDRFRKVVRMEMMRELVISRHHQGRDRSALTFCRHHLSLARETLSFAELPTAHVNMASILSALGQHKDALRHCYIAFQKVSLILSALEVPDSSPFVTGALELEAVDRRGVDGCEEGLQLFERCRSLQACEVNDDVDLNTLAPNFKPPESGASELPPQRRRWGGTLSLIFRNLGAQQEFLGEVDSALLTYKVAHTTASHCLGVDHPVTRQCEQALHDAERTARGRFQPKTSVLQEHSRHTESRRRPNSEPRHQSSILHNESKLRSRRNPKANSFADRPPWNDWFNSDLPVPSHRDDAHRAGAVAKEMMNAEGELGESGYSPLHANSDVDPDGATDASFFEEVSLIPPRAQTTQSTRSFSVAVEGRPHPMQQRVPSPVPSQEHNEVDISAADFSFLQNTYKLRYDPRFSRSRQQAKQSVESRQFKGLAAERRIAEALAAQMGL